MVAYMTGLRAQLFPFENIDGSFVHSFTPLPPPHSCVLFPLTDNLSCPVFADLCDPGLILLLFLNLTSPSDINSYPNIHYFNINLLL